MSSSDPASTSIDLSSLSEFITDDGLLNYSALLNNKEALDTLQQNLKAIAAADTSSMQTHEERLSFALNAYNVTVIGAVIERLKSTPNWRGNTTMWQRMSFFWWQTHCIAGHSINLNDFEKKIRNEFGDARVHCVLNCATLSCPPLAKGTQHSKLHECPHCIHSFAVFVETIVFCFVFCFVQNGSVRQHLKCNSRMPVVDS